MSSLNTARLVRAVAPALLSLAVLLLLARVAAPHWHDLRASVSGARPDLTWGGLAVLLAATHYAIVFRLWKGSLELAGVPLSTRAAADTWIPGLLSRYIPGKIWSNGIRLAVARRLGSPLIPVTGAMGWEALLAIASACAFGLVVFRDWPDPAWRGSAAVVLVLTGGVLALARYTLAQGRFPRWLARSGLRGAPSGGSVLALAALNLLGWAVYGASVWAVARATSPLSLTAFPAVAGAVALAWAGGYLSIVVPAGLGVREGFLVVLLAPNLGAGPAVLMAAGSRLISFGLDLALTALWMWRRVPRPPSPSPSPPSA